MDMMFSGMAIGRFQAAQAASAMSPQVSKTRLDSHVWRRYGRTFSTGLSSGAYGRRRGLVLFGHSERAGGVPCGAAEQEHGVGAGADDARDLVDAVCCIASVFAMGMTTAAPAPQTGQMAPNGYALM